MTVELDAPTSAAAQGNNNENNMVEEVKLNTDIPLTEDGGVIKRILRAGSGEQPTAGSSVNVHYVGTLVSTGEKFDSSRDRGDLFNFKLGVGQVIKAWDIGVASMKIGELAEIICTAEYGYGARGSPPKIPGGASLKFEVELFDFEEGADTFAGRVKISSKRKEEGNEHFKAGQFSEALAAYNKGIKVWKEYLYLKDDESKQKAAMLAALHSNAAACNIKLKEYSAAILDCHKSLDNDPKNPKVLYRLGTAYHMLSEFDKATSHLKEALELAPGDVAIQKELAAIKVSEAKLHNKEKQVYSKMFGAGQ